MIKKSQWILSTIMILLLMGGIIIYIIGNNYMDYDEDIIYASLGQNSSCLIIDMIGGYNYYTIKYSYENNTQLQRIDCNLKAAEFIIGEYNNCWSHNFLYGRIAIVQKYNSSTDTIKMRYIGILLMTISSIYFILLSFIITFNCAQRQDPKIIYQSVPYNITEDQHIIVMEEQYDDMLIPHDQY